MFIRWPLRTRITNKTMVGAVHHFFLWDCPILSLRHTMSLQAASKTYFIAIKKSCRKRNNCNRVCVYGMWEKWVALNNNEVTPQIIVSRSIEKEFADRICLKKESFKIFTAFCLTYKTLYVEWYFEAGMFWAKFKSYIPRQTIMRFTCMKFHAAMCLRNAYSHGNRPQ